MSLTAARSWIESELPALLSRHRVPAVGRGDPRPEAAAALHGAHHVFGFTGRDPAGRATHLTTSRVFPRANLEA